MLAAMIVAVSGHARTSVPLWGPLNPGDWSVGFKVEHRYDFGRSWFPTRDYTGRELDHEPGRPVRIEIWYPSEPATGEEMTLRSYVDFESNDPDFRALEERLRAYDMGEEGGSISGLFQGSPALIEAFLKQPVAARFDAEPAAGPFPLAIYSLGQNNYTQENIVLFEYLASHGYVVATVPHLGTSPRRFHLWIHDPLSYEAQLRDLEFTLQTLAEYPWVDRDHVAAVGHSNGGLYALLLAMRQNDIDAVVGLDASFMTPLVSYEYDYTSAPYFNPSALQVPILQLFRNSDALTYALIDTFTFADRYLIRYDNLTHGDFQSAPLYQQSNPTDLLPSDDLKWRSPDVAVAGFSQVAEWVLRFLDWRFGSEQAGPLPGFFDERVDTIDGVISKQFLHPGLNAPNAEQLVAILMDRGYDAALEELTATMERYPGNEIFSEESIRSIANETRWSGQTEQAIEVFRLAIVAHPESLYLRFKLADTYLDLENLPQAIRVYESILALDPGNEIATRRLEQLHEEMKR